MVCHTLCLVDIYEPWFKSNISRSYGMVLPFIDCIHPSSLGIKMVFELRSRGSTRRHLLRPKGWKQFPSTKEGNRLARRLCYLSRPQFVEYLSLLRISFFWDRHDWFHLYDVPISSMVSVAQARAVLQERHLLRGGTADIFVVVSVSASSEVVEASQSPTHPHVTGSLWCPNIETSNIIAIISTAGFRWIPKFIEIHCHIKCCTQVALVGTCPFLKKLAVQPTKLKRRIRRI